MILEKGSILNERYQIESVIGQGGMSYVYRAKDERMQRPVAIKMLKEEYCEDEEFIRKFQNEAQAAARLNHPNIVAAYDVIDDDANRLHYIVMELVEGITLKNYIQRKGRLNNRETIGIALQVIDGIEQAHRMGIVHRDIKPQNMIVGTDGVVKVADFGIARAATQHTINATVMGSVHYISPEQARTGAADERSDIYSLGCTLYEMLTGKVPYEGDTSVAVIFSHLENSVPRVSELIPGVYSALDKAVYKCMLKQPSERYQHIGELGKDLQRALEQPEGDFVILPELSFRQNDNENADVNSNQGGVREARKRSRAASGDASRSIRQNVNALYMAVAAICVLAVIALLLFMGFRIFKLIEGAGSTLETRPAYSMPSTEESSSEGVKITISALETRLPEILGMNIEEAEDYLSDFDIRLIKGDEEFSDSYQKGDITAYPSGSYSAGDTIPVTLSAGAATLYFYDAAYPDALDSLQATSFSELKEQLDARGISYRYSMEFSDAVAEGNVISTSKPDTRGTGELNILVSRGSIASHTRVPVLSGVSEAEAEAVLAESSLIIGYVSYEESEDAEDGTIIRQSPEEGSIVEKGSSVDITVASGYSSGSERTERSYWYGSLNQTVRLGAGGPGIDGSMLVSIRLRQDINGESFYTTLQTARSYPLGTELQVVYSRIKGEPGIHTGVVEVVDAENDAVLSSFDVIFAPQR